MGLATPEFEHPGSTGRREVLKAISRVAPDVIQDLRRRVDGLAPDEVDGPVASWAEEYHLNWPGIDFVARQTAEAAADPRKWAGHISRKRAGQRLMMLNRKVALADDPGLEKLARLEHRRDEVDALERLPTEARRAWLNRFLVFQGFETGKFKMSAVIDALRADVEEQLCSPHLLATRERFSEELKAIQPDFNPEWCLKDDAPAQVGRPRRFVFHYDYLEGDLSFLEKSTLDNAVLSAFQEAWSNERAALEEAYGAAGFLPVAERRARHHFDWFVAHQVLGAPFKTIGRACRPTVVDETVRMACTDVADSIGAKLDRRSTRRKWHEHESSAELLRPRLEGTYQPPKVA